MQQVSVRSVLAKAGFVLQLILRGLIPPIYSFGKLEKFCRAKLEKNPGAYPPRLFLAHLYKDYAKYPEARREFETLLRQGYKNDSIYKAMGDVCYKLQDHNGARRYLDLVVNRYARNKVFNCHIGISYMHAGEYERALHYLMRAETLSLKDAGLYEAMGFCFFRLEQFESSAESYRKALSVAPDDPRSREVRNNAALARVHLANRFLERGERAEAIAQFHLALQISPEDSIVESISRTLREI